MREAAWKWQPLFYLSERGLGGIFGIDGMLFLNRLNCDFCDHFD